MSQSYSRINAVNYALTYGNKPNKDYNYFNVYGEDGGDCTNFVSQCLFAGGIQMATDGKIPWWYKDNNSSNLKKHTWSLSWTSSSSLYWCFKTRAKSSDIGPRGIEVDNVQDLDYGDIILYRNQNGIINHSGIITGFYYDLPLITQHSPDLINISYYKPHKSGMHFIKIID